MSEFSKNDCDKRRNKKRKKSVLSNARHYAKKGHFGRGNSLSEDKYQYFVRILEIHKDGFSSDEEKQIFANNALEQTENEETNFSCNQIGCRVIELLLPFANSEILNRFINAFNTDLRLYCTHEFASHVIQALLRVCYNNSLSETDEKLKENYKNFVLKISKFLLNNLEDFIDDKYANHIIREVFYTFAHIPKDEKTKTQSKTEEETLTIEEEYENIIKEFLNRLILWPHFKDLPFDTISSGLLQVLLEALKKIDLKLFRTVVKKFINESFSVKSECKEKENELKDVFKSKSATILLEKCITLATPKLLTKIFTKVFSGSLATLAKLKDTNFAVQKLVSCCTEKSEFETMFEELSGSFDEILNCGYTGVILAIAESCKKLTVKQSHFIQALMKSLNCLDPQERQNSFIPCASRLIPFDKLESVQQQKYFVHLHGSIIIQRMLEFNKPIKIVNSLLSMDTEDLKNLFCDGKGTYIIDSYMQSPFIGEKNREKLVWRMQGTYQDLASSKSGSRSLEAIWNAANLKQKIKIMEELSDKDGLWSNSIHGIIIARKFNLELYKRNLEQWKQATGKMDVVDKK